MRLARSEEREVAKEFGDDWAAYAAHTPAFWPRWKTHYRGPGRTTSRPGRKYATSRDRTVAPKRPHADEDTAAESPSRRTVRR